MSAKLSNTERAVAVAKQLRRIENRRRQTAAARIASMSLAEQMALACTLWRAEQRLAKGQYATA